MTFRLGVTQGHCKWHHSIGRFLFVYHYILIPYNICISITAIRQTLVENRDFFMPQLQLTPSWGFRRNIAITFGVEKLELWMYHTVKKSWRICLHISIQYTNVTDGRTDRRTDGRTPHHGIALCRDAVSVACAAKTENHTSPWIQC